MGVFVMHAKMAHLRITEADKCYSNPYRHMPKDEYRAYLRIMLLRNGFDLTRKMYVMSVTPFDHTYIQERTWEESPETPKHF